MQKLSLSFIVAVLVFLSMPSQALAQTPKRAEFSFVSEKSDYIGGGAQQTYTQVESNFDITLPTDGSVLVFRIEGKRDRLEISFTAPAGRLKVGVYEDVERWGFQQRGKPGFDVSMNGRGCNKCFSSFEIKTVSFNEQGKLLLFDASFIQRSDEADAPPLRGKIYYRLN